MDKETKILIGALIIIFISIFLFNFDITGFSIKNLSFSSIKVEPEVILANERIFITVYPGSGGVNNNINFYNAEDDLRKASVEICKGSYKCTEEVTISYWVPDSWKPGVYYIKVYDYNRKDFIIEDFTIKRGES